MRIENLCKTYQVKKAESVNAISHITLDLPETGMVFILGKSGSGKSTLLKLLAGLEAPTEGEIYFHGKNLAKCSVKELDSYRNTYCGFIFQEYNLIPELNVGDNIALALQMQGEKETKEKVEKVLRQVELSGYEKRKISELSGGQRQRVAIARAIIKDPEIIFADEPTGALDQKTGDAVFSLLKELSKEHLILAVTHDREFAEQYGDRIIELVDGEVYADSSSQRETKEAETTFSVKRARLPLKAAFKVGSGNFKFHPLRLIATLLLSIVAFTLFAVPLALSLWDNEKAFVDAVYENQFTFSKINKQERMKDSQSNIFERFLGAQSKNYRAIPLTKDDITKLQSFSSVPFLRRTRMQLFGFQSQICGFVESIRDNSSKAKEFNALTDSAEENYENAAKGFVFASESAMEYYHFKTVGRLPENREEIAITEGLFRTLCFWGFTDEQGEKYEVKTYEDIIGKKINVNFDDVHSNIDNYITITGVVENGCNKECALSQSALHNEIHERLFVSEDVMEIYNKINYFMEAQELCLLALPEKADFAALSEYIHDSAKEDINFNLFNQASTVISSKEGGMVTMLTNLCLYIGIIFFFIGFLFLVNFLNISMRRQMKQIGVLSAMGMDRRGVLKIYGSVTAMICLATFLFSYAFTLISGIFINRYFTAYFTFSVSVMQFQILVPIALLLSLAVVALFGCVIPVYLYKRKFAAELINKGQIK